MIRQKKHKSSIKPNLANKPHFLKPLPPPPSLLSPSPSPIFFFTMKPINDRLYFGFPIYLQIWAQIHIQYLWALGKV